jgi:hypothetical protein
MVKGQKTTERFDKRINIRVTATAWHKIMLLAQEDDLSPSAWLRNQIMKIIKGQRKDK